MSRRARTQEQEGPSLGDVLDGLRAIAQMLVAGGSLEPDLAAAVIAAAQQEIDDGE